MKCVYGILLLIVLVLLCGCTGTAPGPVTPGETTPAPAVVTTPASPATETVLAELSNARPNASVTLAPGAVLLSFQSDADGPRRMFFGISEGKTYSEGDDLVMSGPNSGSVIFGPPDAAEYQLTGSGSGTWTAKLTRVDSTHPLNAPVNLSGNGAYVSPLISLEKGEYIFSRDETGYSTPLFEFRYANGSAVMNADNTCALPCPDKGLTNPFVIIAIPETGSYLLSVIPRDIPHAWNVSISAVPAIPAMGPGPAILPTP